MALNAPFGKISQKIDGWNHRTGLSLAVCIILSSTKEFLRILANKISGFFCRLFNKKIAVEENQLLSGHEKIDASETAWLTNLALLRNITTTTPMSEEERKEVGFLATNYLCKTAPIHIKTMRLFFSSLESLFQVNPLAKKEDVYHRFSVAKLIKVGSKFNEKLALSKTSPFILTDTVDFEHLLPLQFSVIKTRHPSVDAFLALLTTHFSQGDPQELLNQQFSMPFLLDVTETSLGRAIVTGEENERNLFFEREFTQFKKEITRLEKSAVDALITERPELSRYRSKLIEFVKKNTTCICRTQVDDQAGIKVLPLFKELKGRRVLDEHHDLVNFMIATGIGMGAVSLRREMNSGLSYRSDISYTVASSQEGAQEPAQQFYPHKEDFLKSALYQRLTASFCGVDSEVEDSPLGNLLEERRDFLAENPHIHLLGKATLELVTGALDKIDNRQWEEIHSHPVYSQIVQNSLFRIRESLASAELHLADYNKFAQEIEFIHAELTTLLEITRPYGEEDFSPLYQEALMGRVPTALHSFVKGGLGKTAANLCAGIISAVQEVSDKPFCVWSKGFYFEQAAFVGYENQFDVFIDDTETSRKADLYFGQFNPNIEIASDFSHYERRDIAKDVRDLIASGKAADKLTVAVDCTIDQYHSENVRRLLEEFETEIRMGRINFVFFESGQKFDMLGMDNYYGAPFYVVNNNDPYWRPFNSLFTREVHKTDPLSHQWFCLSTEQTQDSLEQYRKLIFDNTREILDQIPESLLPKSPLDNSQTIRVNTAEGEMDAAFIDIKISGNNHKLLCVKILGEFYENMLSEGVKLQTRATFGLYHPNALIISVNEVPNSSTIRLHPGLNPHENRAFIKFFQTLADEQG